MAGEKPTINTVFGQIEHDDYLKRLNNGLTGSLLKELRETKGWTQKQLADISGVGITTICEIESDVQKLPTTLTLYKLNKALGGTAWQDRWANPVAQYRMAHNLTRAAMARQCRVSRQAIINIENCHAGDKTLFRVSKVMGVTPLALKRALGRV